MSRRNLVLVHGPCSSAGGGAGADQLDPCQGARIAVVPDQVRRRVSTLLDVSWSTMQLLSLALGGIRVAAIGIQPLSWIGEVRSHRGYRRRASGIPYHSRMTKPTVIALTAAVRLLPYKRCVTK